MNVTLVLILGIAATGIIGILTGSINFFDWFGSLGTGITGMGDLIIITLMAGGMLELIRFNGGVDYIIQKLTKHVNSKRGAELCIATLVSIANFCTANNTIAIITVGPLANDIATRYFLVCHPGNYSLWSTNVNSFQTGSIVTIERNRVFILSGYHRNICPAEYHTPLSEALLLKCYYTFDTL